MKRFRGMVAPSGVAEHRIAVQRRATLAPEGAVAMPRPLLGLNRIRGFDKPPTLNGNRHRTCTRPA